jgi:glutaryl-CoA dehydrogenase
MTTAQTDRWVGEDGRTPGRPGPHDFLNLEAHLSEEKWRIRSQVRSFVRERIEPNINERWERAHFPRELVPEMGSLGLLGMHLSGYGCAGKSAVTTALRHGARGRRLGAEDLRLGPGLPGDVREIHKLGTEEQKTVWLQPMARGEAMGCFGLTKPR